ncbi:MAG: restriction endonuclease subunit S [Cyclobacteriaceae bacterium]|nr:restriction endonuclease subunit S [Cyclobacteriaceae bacterium]
MMDNLKPKLNFVEFDEPWLSARLGELCDVKVGGTPDTKIQEYWEGNIPWIGSGEIKNDLINKPTRFISELGLKNSSTTLLPKDTPVLAMTGATLGKVGYLNFACCGNQSVAGFINLKNIDSKFLYFNLQTITKQILSVAGGAAQTGINKGNIENLIIHYPSSILHQSKIAACLSSLDEVITAESQKLELLKQHKKGLLQNLFPQAGETVPKLRFKEFMDSGEWVEKRLGEVYEFKVTNSFSRECLNYLNGEVKNIHYGDIHTKFNTLFDITKEYVPYINPDLPIDKIKADCYCKEGDIIFADASEDLNDVGKSVEIVNLNGEKLVSGLHTLLARQKDDLLSIGFGGFLFKSDWIRKQIQREAQGAKVLGVSASRISNINIKFPKSKKEQQKIASCLSSLDDLITAQTKKIELLQQHKKGLLQGLFPNVNEVAA